MTSLLPRIGTAGWSLPPREQVHFPAGESHLERYARVFRAVEINSTFRRAIDRPPKLEPDPRAARAFLGHLRKRFAGTIAIEPRHASWFTPAGEKLLAALAVARVAADPPRAPRDGEPGGWKGVAYYRLHGSPRVYYSSYEESFLDELAKRLETWRGAGIPSWCIFDNTTLGAGTANALALVRRSRQPAFSAP